ncbi:MAG TPA: YfiR family protein [Sideroxyarcus sp.]|nr:YfiR family protein [Sideroxyarcus sp.]
MPRFALLLLLLAGMGAQPCRAELSELQIKSAYIFNFIKFVEWPTDAAKPGGKLRLCVVGNDKLRASLAALDGRKLRDRELQIMPHTGSDALHACHVLYIDGPEKRRFIPIIKSLGDAPTLTISDIPGFAERGGCIGLLYRDNKMLFEVNLASARKAGLQLSGQMLNLAANIFGR